MLGGRNKKLNDKTNIKRKYSNVQNKNSNVHNRRLYKHPNINGEQLVFFPVSTRPSALEASPHPYPHPYSFVRGQDQAILAEEERLVIIRFSHDWDADAEKSNHLSYDKRELLGW
ncbi:hypothetical protein H5410_037636 [Solanum commersonii]|uniref:Uncharacterized protein n=1 Tax=Solanum commersonii TaxID=4109 RepID=A0A9J5YAS5_SOLCO|nr:hypothetical protein H5410_037636 [Solanum commersonii]